jgi:hypothetical protein
MAATEGAEAKGGAKHERASWVWNWWRMRGRRRAAGHQLSAERSHA